MKNVNMLSFVAILIAINPYHCFGQKAQQKFWTSYVEACSPGSQLNGKAYFLGATNPLGPGSVWGTAGGTTNLVADESFYFGTADAHGHYLGVIYPVAPASCGATGSRKWDFKLGLPISFGNDAVNLSVALSHARDITITIDGVEIDTMPTAVWENASQKLDHHNAAYTDAVDGKHFLMTAGVAVTGLTVKYTLGSSISAGVKANIQAERAINIGTAQNPATAQVDISTDGQVVTLKAASKAFVLGEFRPIQKVTQQAQADYFETIQQNGQPSAGSQMQTTPKVNSNVVDTGTLKISATDIQHVQNMQIMSTGIR